MTSLRSLLPRLESLVGPIRGSLLIVAAASALVGVLEALLLFIVATVASSLTSVDATGASFGPLRVDDLSPTTLLWIGFALIPVMFLFQLVSGWAIARICTRGIHGARMQLIDAHAHATWPAKEELTGSALVQLAHSNVSKVGEALLSGGTFTAAAANFVALVVSAFAIDPAAALAILVGVGALLAMVAPLARSARRHQRHMVGLSRAYSASLHEYAAIGREIEVFGVQEGSIAAIDEQSRRQGSALRRARLVSTTSTATFKCAALLLIVGLLAAVRWSGTERVAAFAAISLVLLRSVSYGQAIQTTLHSLAESSSWIDDLAARVEELASSRRRTSDQPSGPDRRGTPAAISVRDVTFRYPSGAPVFTGLGLEIGGGEYVGLAGSSGVGKTTLAELLLGLRQPTSGVITADGLDLAEIADGVWSRRTAFVPQEPVLTQGSVLDNVRFYRPWITDEQAEAALEAANVLSDTRQWADGVSTDVGALGSKLSGGQKQRIAIARALVDEPGLLVLDEPTSALDEISEGRIASALDRIRGTVTIVVIAHRLTTLQRCDRVVVLADGGVGADGTPRALGDLHRLLERQR
ncbi:MAG: ABC transporter ATP-binding protein [Acidimicrobiales bacterium]